MRGVDAMQEASSTVANLDDFVPADHRLRGIRLLVLRYNLLFRWFVGLAIDDTVRDHSTFPKNRDRLLEQEVVESFFTARRRRTACRRGHARCAALRVRSSEHRCRQGLRHDGLRGCLSRAQYRAACCVRRHPGGRQRARRPDHAACELSREPNRTQADGGALRLGQDHRPDSPDLVSPLAASRPAVQADCGSRQPYGTRPNADRGACRSRSMRASTIENALAHGSRERHSRPNSNLSRLNEGKR